MPDAAGSVPLALSRRRFLAQTSLLGGCALTGGLRLAAADDAPPRPKVAVVFTAFAYRLHAHVLLENFLQPYLFNGQKTDPGVDVVSFYAAQFPKDDMARDVAKQFNIPIYPTIAESLCLGGQKLAVDAVLLIGEHGDYPENEKGQQQYPRKEFFDEIVAVFERSGRVAPVFNDKHLSYRWDWAKEMYDTAQRLRIPFMAGSSVPLAERRPPLELPAGAKMLDAVSIHGGPPERYGFHALEVLQSFVEARAGGETGIAKVQFLEGDALWKAADAGLWSPKLAEVAMAAERGPGKPPLRELVASLEGGDPPHGILVNYRDGLRGIALGLGGNGSRWNFACQLAGEKRPRAPGSTTGLGTTAICSRRSRMPFKSSSASAAPLTRWSARCWSPVRSMPRWSRVSVPGCRSSRRNWSSPISRSIFAPCARWAPVGRSSPKRRLNPPGFRRLALIEAR